MARSAEIQDELNLNLYDYGARNYDPAIGRWFNIDPLAEKYPSRSPYEYILSNLVRFTDPTWMVPDGIFVDSDGNIIGWDGKSDNRVYGVSKELYF
ncbi:MAG TPA: hypothetical protein DEQ26_01845 [Flavobacteriaceae bacterium]|nr:hypothetical protein [Flavobacteriaceae bacterium]